MVLLPRWSRRAAGDAAEAQASRWLIDRGLRLVEQNWRCRRGEIDLIMLDGNTANEQLVFVEVRQRSSAGWGGAAASITAAKQRRVILAAEDFLQRRPQFRAYASRFDVVTVDGAVSLQEDRRPQGHDPQQAGELNWIKHAFEG